MTPSPLTTEYWVLFQDLQQVSKVAYSLLVLGWQVMVSHIWKG